MDLNGSDLINRELVSINIAPLDFNQSTSSAQADQVITVVFRLIQIRKQSILLLNDLQERYNQLEQGEKQNINIIAKLRDKETNLSRINQNQVSKIESFETTCSTLNSKIALLNDQLKVSRNANVQEKTRYHHEIRKRDKEIEKLKQKLLKLSSASTRSDQKIKIPKILNKPTLVKHNSLMVVNKVEEREKELLIENQALKNSIQAIYTAINAKRDVHIAIDDIQIARFTLPYSSIKDSVETMVFESLEQLNVQELAPVVSYNDSENVHLLNENKTLKTQLNEQFDVINQQNRLLEMSMNADFYIVDQVDESDTVFEKTSVELKQMALNVSNREQKLKKDRMLFTEAAIKLGFERKMLDNEKIRLGLDVPENKSPPGTAKKVTFTPSMDRIHEFSESLEESMIENVNDYSEMETIKTPISCRGLREEKDYSEIKTPTRVLRESNSIIGTPFGRTPMKDSLFSAPLSDLKVRKIEERILEMQKTPIRRLKRM